MSNPMRIEPIARRDGVERVLKTPRVTLLTPQEREEARRRREALRKQRAAKDRQA
jgi:hypothetical protein